MNLLPRLLAGLSVLLACTALAGGDAAAGKEKAGACASCHGLDGNSTLGEWPKIAGQHEAYLVRQITLIRDGDRPVPLMDPFVAGLSDDDIANLAAYFSSQTMSVAVADEDLVAAGQLLYRAGNPESGIPACMACHGPAGEGNPLAGYPALAGQHSVYSANMLQQFREGATWGTDDTNSAVMAGVSKYLTTDEINAVASFMQGLHQASE
jgi:cytochrome c553